MSQKTKNWVEQVVEQVEQEREAAGEPPPTLDARLITLTTQDEKAALLARAQRAGLSMSALVRRVLDAAGVFT